MRPGREIDTEISQKVMGHNVKVKQKQLWEDTPLGDRPLRKYSNDISSAWEVAERMNITMIPVENGHWFAMVGQPQRWESPAEFLKYLAQGNFAESGAALEANPSLAICMAALKAVHQRDVANKVETAENSSNPESPTTH